MAAKIIIVAGSKGGVGKSLVTAALLDAFGESKREVFLIDSDTSNPDVYTSYSEELPAAAFNLDEKQGWINLLNTAHANSEKTIVVNAAARSNDGIKNFSSLLLTALPELQRELVTLWVVNRQRDSIELLKEYRQLVPGKSLHVVRNTYFGTPEKFELFNNSKMKTEIEKGGGKVIDFPDLADRVSDEMTNKRLTIAKAIGELQFGEKIELQRWRAEAHKALSVVNE